MLRNRGLDVEHKSPKKYYKYICQKQHQSEHGKFLTAVKQFIKEHNADPESCPVENI